MSKTTPLNEKGFFIRLETDAEVIINPALGSFKQYVVRANGLEIARFIDPVSSNEYVRFLTESKFLPFKNSTQGTNILEIIHRMGQGMKLAPEVKDGKEIIIRSLDQDQLPNIRK